MGGVGLTGNGTLHVAWTRSSTSDDPSSYTAHQALGDTPNSISAAELLAAGTGPYSGDRWGDYVGVAQDPQVPNQAWDGNQYSGGEPNGGPGSPPLRTTGTTYVPIAPVRVLDTAGRDGAVRTRSRANTARPWQVTDGDDDPGRRRRGDRQRHRDRPDRGGYVSVTVTPTSSPPSSTINFPTGETRANNVTIPLSSAGKLSAVYKAGAGKKTQLIFDVTGYFLADDTGATFTPLAPGPRPRHAQRRRPARQVRRQHRSDAGHRRRHVGYPDDRHRRHRQPDDRRRRRRRGYASVTKDRHEHAAHLDDQLPDRLGPGERRVRAARREPGALSIVYKAQRRRDDRHRPRHHRLLRAGHAAGCGSCR